jgi:hypothetical protein
MTAETQHLKSTQCALAARKDALCDRGIGVFLFLYYTIIRCNLIVRAISRNGFAFLLPLLLLTFACSLFVRSNRLQTRLTRHTSVDKQFTLIDFNGQ